LYEELFSLNSDKNKKWTVILDDKGIEKAKPGLQ
jgi:hypothetical protein